MCPVKDCRTCDDMSVCIYICRDLCSLHVVLSFRREFINSVPFCLCGKKDEFFTPIQTNLRIILLGSELWTPGSVQTFNSNLADPKELVLLLVLWEVFCFCATCCQRSFLSASASFLDLFSEIAELVFLKPVIRKSKYSVCWKTPVLKKKINENTDVQGLPVLSM